MAQFGMNDKDAAAIILGLVLILVSILLLIWGCMNYAEAKGYSKKVGLIGLLGIIGLIVLIVLPDKIRDGPEARMSTRKIWGLVLMALGLGLFMVGYVLEEAAYERDRYSNRVFEVSLIVLGLILLTVSLVMLLYNRKNLSRSMLMKTEHNRPQQFTGLPSGGLPTHHEPCFTNTRRRYR